MSTWVVVRDDELYHHGIKGQKWGIRRWQNEDGSLTEEGKARYGTVENFEKAQKRKKIAIGVAAGVGTAAAIGGGIAIAANVNRNKKNVTPRELRLTDRTNDKTKWKTAKQNRSAFKTSLKGRDLSDIENLYDRLTAKSQNKAYSKVDNKIMTQRRRDIAKEISKRQGKNVMQNIGNIPLNALRSAGTSEDGKTLFKGFAKSFWATPASKIVTGTGTMLGAAVVGYSAKKLKDLTREETDDEEMANYMWQNPNKK